MFPDDLKDVKERSIIESRRILMDGEELILNLKAKIIMRVVRNYVDDFLTDILKNIFSKVEEKYKIISSSNDETFKHRFQYYNLINNFRKNSFYGFFIKKYYKPENLIFKIYYNIETNNESYLKEHLFFFLGEILHEINIRSSKKLVFYSGDRIMQLVDVDVLKRYENRFFTKGYKYNRDIFFPANYLTKVYNIMDFETDPFHNTILCDSIYKIMENVKETMILFNFFIKSNNLKRCRFMLLLSRIIKRYIRGRNNIYFNSNLELFLTNDKKHYRGYKILRYLVKNHKLNLCSDKYLELEQDPKEKKKEFKSIFKKILKV